MNDLPPTRKSLETTSANPVSFTRDIGALNVPTGPAPIPVEATSSDTPSVERPASDYLSLTRNHLSADYFEVADIYKEMGWEGEMASLDKYITDEIARRDMPDTESSGRQILDSLAEQLGVVNRPKDEKMQAIHTYTRVLTEMRPLQELKRALERVW